MGRSCPGPMITYGLAVRTHGLRTIRGPGVLMTAIRARKRESRCDLLRDDCNDSPTTEKLGRPIFNWGIRVWVRTGIFVLRRAEFSTWAGPRP